MSSESTMFESLEQRVLLSTSTDFGMIDWAGGEIEARTGSWILTFERAMSEAENLRLVQETLSIIDVVPEEVESIGRGRYARVQLSQRLTTSMSCMPVTRIGM